MQDGSDNFGTSVTSGIYTRGAIVYSGVEYPPESIWFQEGIIATPEPSTTLLCLAGSGVWGGLWLRRRRK
jgi:hypothetical protein